MIQTEKMTSIGKLAAGMAHELNNPLGAILQNAQIVQRRLSPELESNRKPAEEAGIDLHRLQPYLQKRQVLASLNGIQEAAIKAARIIANMLQFSRKSESQKAPAQLTEVLEEALELAGKTYSANRKHDFRNIRIVRDFETDLPLVLCNKMEIEQVVLNLLINAAHVLALKTPAEPGQLTLRLATEPTQIRLEIEDNGPGMAETTRKRIFEPFFTTKPAGEGTGLGLSVSYMIITQNHQGTIEVESEVGKGTRFIIRLPLKDTTAATS